MNATSEKQIAFNVRVHDRRASRYEKTHSEIYNPIEQERLRSKLATAWSLVQTGSAPRRAMDFGCGAGNLTSHMLALGFDVTAADVSPRFVELVAKRFQGAGSLSTQLLNGRDLGGFPDASFDFVATYSVLHHVPDYLLAVAEMCRVLKPGGVIYLDHEVNENFWNRPPLYREFLATARPRSRTRYLNPMYVYRSVRITLDPHWSEEGDIHVFPDDHIEWQQIEDVLKQQDCEIALRDDYLLYRTVYPLPIYEAYRSRCSDTRLMVARKR